MYNVRMVMNKKDLYIREDQIAFIGKLPGMFSEHIRRAIDDYINKIKQGVNITISPSKK
jgi:hypothetical protein